VQHIGGPDGRRDTARDRRHRVIRDSLAQVIDQAGARRRGCSAPRRLSPTPRRLQNNVIVRRDEGARVMPR
jgi:hypothetical protein